MTAVGGRWGRFKAVLVAVVTNRSVATVNTFWFIAPDIDFVEDQSVSAGDMLRFIIIAMPVFTAVVRIWEVSVPFPKLRAFHAVTAVSCSGCGRTFRCGETMSLVVTGTRLAGHVKMIVTVSIEGVEQKVPLTGLPDRASIDALIELAALLWVLIHVPVLALA